MLRESVGDRCRERARRNCRIPQGSQKVHPPQRVLSERRVFSGRAGHREDLARKSGGGRGRVPFFSMSAAEFVEMIVGVGARNAINSTRLPRRWWRARRLTSRRSLKSPGSRARRSWKPRCCLLLMRTAGTLAPLGRTEIVLGLLITIGLLTSYAAFIASGEMAVAYFIGHFPKSFWPLENAGEPAVLFCFIFLYMATQGSGIWSVDAAGGRREIEAAASGR